MASRSKRSPRSQDEKQIRVNEDIIVPEVLLIDEKGEKIGKIATSKALELAYERGYDLVEVGKNSNPPVCKVMDYGKYKYEISKKLHEAKRKQKVVHVKEIKLRPKTEEHDFRFKVKHAYQFLENGNKVKVTVLFRGREMAYQQLGLELLDRFAAQTEKIGFIEMSPRSEGRTAVMVLAPKK